MAYQGTPTTQTGSANSTTIAVPSGLQEGDITVLVVSADNTATAPTWPSGYTQLFAPQYVTYDNGSLAAAWKRQGSTPDSGNYTFNLGGVVGLENCISCHVFRGRNTTDPPVAGTPNIVNTGSGSPRTISANGVTALAGDDLMWISVPDVNNGGVGNGHTPPTDFTERSDLENNWVNQSVATRDNVSAGATGTVSGTFAMTGGGQCGYIAVLVRIPAEAAAGGGQPPRSMHQFRQRYWQGVGGFGAEEWEDRDSGLIIPMDSDKRIIAGRAA